MKQCVIYVKATSTMNNEAIALRVDRLRNYAEKKGYRVDYVFIDQVHSERSVRPQFNEMLKYLAETPREYIVLAKSIDQLCKLHAHAEYLKIIAKEIHCLDEELVVNAADYMSNLIFELGVSAYLFRLILAEKGINLVA